ncbi:MAG: hypothetical protein U1F43_16185 [Myxococcota bacterium]
MLRGQARRREAALTALAKRPPRAAGPIRVVRASADEVLLAEFGTLERDGAPKLDPIDVLVRRGADGWRVAGLSGPTGKACWKEAGAVHADPPWRAAVCLDAAKAAWKDSHPCKDPLRLCQQTEGGIEQSLRDCLAP